jgi:hypothetical protein
LCPVAQRFGGEFLRNYNNLPNPSLLFLLNGAFGGRQESHAQIRDAGIGVTIYFRSGSLRPRAEVDLSQQLRIASAH